MAAAALVGALALSVGPAAAASPTPPGVPGAVYVLTNAAAGNAVAIFARAADGSLTAAGTVPTGGLGTGAGLGSQGAVILSDNNRWLYAVDAGSNDIAALRVAGAGLVPAGTVASGGVMPISLTVNGDLLYVLNAGSETISGFRIGHNGSLSPLSGSTLPLSGTGVGPAEVSFSPDGRTLVVTEKNTNLIDTYRVGRDGRPDGPYTTASAGQTPFGFAFARKNTLIVSDAFGGAANASALSSYRVENAHDVDVVTGVAPTNQTAACWVATTDNGRYAYTTNAGSDSISGYGVDHAGALSLLTPDGRTGVLAPGSHPTDLGFSHNSRYLYALAGGTGSIAPFDVAADGSLTALSGVSGLPASAVGLAAR